jgi:tetratricopeptide (TPR) repeat protein
MERYVKEAVELAIQGRWQEAVAANRAILKLFPDDVETHNRLGRALMEIGDYAAAREAYGHALELDRYNNIAKKNLKRLSELGELAQKENYHKVVIDVFVEETSKARTVSLGKLAPKEVLARMAPGEEISLQVEGERLIAKSAQDEYLGEVEPKYGLRLAKLIKGGNRYTAVITSLEEDELKVLISEIYQHPSQAGRLSFPPKKRERFRPYVKERLLRQRAEEEADEDLETAEPEMEGFSEVDF